MVTEPPRFLFLHTQPGRTEAGGSAIGLRSLPPPTQQVPRPTASRLKPAGLGLEAGILGTQGSQAVGSPPWFARWHHLLLEWYHSVGSSCWVR